MNLFREEKHFLAKLGRGAIAISHYEKEGMPKKNMLAFTAIAAVATLLAGCAAPPPAMKYTGNVTQGRLGGARVAIETTVTGGQFGPLPCSDAEKKYCHAWAMPANAIEGTYNKLLYSALTAEGAQVVPASGATVVVRTTIHPAPGHTHFVWSKMNFGKTIGMAFVPLSHTRYFVQHASLVDTVTVARAGEGGTSQDVTLVRTAPFEASTLESNTIPFADIATYRDLQATGVAKALTAVEAAVPGAGKIARN